MSRLIFKGDTIQNFGEFLPAPFIERVAVYDSYINVDLSLYILVNEDEEQQSELQARLESLSHYVYLQPYISSFIDKLGDTYWLDVGTASEFPFPDVVPAYLSPIDQIKDKKQNILSYMYLAAAGLTEAEIDSTIREEIVESWLEQMGGYRNWEDEVTDIFGTSNYDGKQFYRALYYIFGFGWHMDRYIEGGLAATPLETWVSQGVLGRFNALLRDGSLFIAPQTLDWSPSSDLVYDAEGRPIIKYTAKVTFNLPSGMTEYTGLLDDGWASYTDLTLFTFSSTIDLDVTGTEDFDESVLENITLSSNLISDISYETIFENGEIAGQAEQIWVDSSGNPFDGTPLQEIMATYHKPTKITHKNIVDGFEDLLSKFEAFAQTDSILESARDSVSYVLAVYGTEPDLLPQLNKLRKAWPSKSSVTNTGKLYHAFKRALFNASKVVGGDPPVAKQLVLNPKIIDLREGASEEWSQRAVSFYGGEYYREWEWDAYGAADYWDFSELEPYYPVSPTNGDDPAIDELFVYSDWLVSAETFFTEDDDPGENEIASGLKVNGYIFIDIEKLLFRSSFINKIFSTKTIDSLFGKQLINSRFRSLNQLYLSAYASDPENAEIELIQFLAPNETGTDDAPILQELTRFQYPLVLEHWPTAVTNDGDTLYSYTALRNFEYATEDEDANDYRLMCIEFQDLLPAPDEDDVATYVDEGTSLDMQYRLKLAIVDETPQIYDALVASYNACLTGSMLEYYEITSETCNYNNIDGKFNNFFIDGITTAYEDDPGGTPWFRAAYLYNLHRDLLFETFDGDADQIIAATKTLSDRIGPYAGTVDSVETFYLNFKALYDDYYEDDGTCWEVREAVSGLGIYTETYFEDFPYIYFTLPEADASGYVATEEDECDALGYDEDCGLVNEALEDGTASQVYDEYDASDPIVWCYQGKCYNQVDYEEESGEEAAVCVIATHALKHGGFAPEVKSRAEDWCVRNLHDRWYGEAWRRGYRYYGRKYIENGTAHQRYQEFQDGVDFVTGHNRTFRGAISFVCRTAQFFLKGLFINEQKDKR